MTKEIVLDIINKKYSPLSVECQQDLFDCLTLASIEKGQTIVREGQFSHKAYFLLHGCARAYYLKDGKDVSDWFAFENEFISSIVSFFGKKPSPHYIEALQDSLVIEISRSAFENLADKHHDFERLIRVVVTNTMLSQQERISSILFHTAQERYEHILQIRPDITNRVPLMHIASYLGMTLETLSRIRNSKKGI
ncbi:MAG: Crp/Fnr family transcriptional regulator [Bacteroidota bacterium]